MGRSIDLEWETCELDTMLDVQWACSWATVHGKYIGQVMGHCETPTVSNLLAHEWAIHSLIKGLWVLSLVSYGVSFISSFGGNVDMASAHGSVFLVPILGLRPVNERRRYKVTQSLIG